MMIKKGEENKANLSDVLIELSLVRDTLKVIEVCLMADVICDEAERSALNEGIMFVLDMLCERAEAIGTVIDLHYVAEADCEKEAS